MQASSAPIDFDFTAPPAKSAYDAEVALQCFQSMGKTLTVAPGKTLFTENRKANPLLLQKDRMYYLLDGTVVLSVNKKPVGRVQPGEVFGEMTVITGMPRTATAKTETACRLIALDKSALQAALQRSPDFGLQLMGIMIARLRDILAKPGTGITRETTTKDRSIFDRKMLDQLVDELGPHACLRYPAGKLILQEGQAGVLTYVVLKGTVSISIQGSPVDRIGPGGLFGEMALISGKERLASASAETQCELLAINRSVFLDLVQSNPAFVLALLGAVGNRARYIAAMQS